MMAIPPIESMAASLAAAKIREILPDADFVIVVRSRVGRGQHFASSPETKILDDMKFEAKRNLVEDLRKCQSVEEMQGILVAIDGRHEFDPPDPDPVAKADVFAPDVKGVTENVTWGAADPGLPAGAEQHEAAERLSDALVTSPQGSKL